ncbi:MAG: right-handed parallel beta-helix repeat-containing protein [Candidatus Thorarchaeota archaeon]
MIKLHSRRTTCLIVSILYILLLVLPASGKAVDVPTTATLIAEQQPGSDTPIVITENVDFENQGWPGAGTQEDPYVIANLYISGMPASIEVVNVDVHFVIRNCTLEAKEGDDAVGIRLVDVKNALIEECTIGDMEWGIHLQNSSGCEVTDCSIYNCNTGVLFRQVGNSMLHNCAAYRCNFGVKVYESENCIFQSNRVFGNKIAGISLGPHANRCTVFQNSIGWNEDWTGTCNAQDEGQDNSWNESTQGNSWANYDGNETYPISGNASSVDYHPALLEDEEPPQVNSPEDITYEYGSKGFAINWSFSDDYPRSIRIIRNNVTMKPLDWHNNKLSFKVDNLPYGVHNCTIVLTDWGGNQRSDSVRVIVMYSIFGGLGTPYVLVSSALSVFAVAAVILVMIRTRE